MLSNLKGKWWKAGRKWGLEEHKSWFIFVNVRMSGNICANSLMQYTATWLPCDVFFSLGVSFYWKLCSCHVMLCPKQNSELYIFHEPKGNNFMLADKDLLPTKYHSFLFFQGLRGHYCCPPLSCLSRITMMLPQRNTQFDFNLIMLKTGFKLSGGKTHPSCFTL